MKIKYMFFMRNVRLVKLCVLKQVRRQTGVARFLLWFTDAYINNCC
jgi:hypothetical protein